MQGNWSHSVRRVRLESAQALSVRGLSRGRVLSLQVVAQQLMLMLSVGPIHYLCLHNLLRKGCC
jgi:hypothetical protein